MNGISEWPPPHFCVLNKNPQKDTPKLFGRLEECGCVRVCFCLEVARFVKEKKQLPLRCKSGASHRLAKAATFRLCYWMQPCEHETGCWWRAAFVIKSTFPGSTTVIKQTTSQLLSSSSRLQVKNTLKVCNITSGSSLTSCTLFGFWSLMQ